MAVVSTTRLLKSFAMAIESIVFAILASLNGV
jgi:hypothetical protein